MFEINLVPDIKAEMLRKVRLRNFVIFVSIIVAAGACGAVALLGSVVTGQNIAMGAQDREIKCRLDGPMDTKQDKYDCDLSYGQAILKIKNINEFLTIQDQMNKIAEINKNKKLLSRVFGILDVILPTGDDVVEISEMSIDMGTSTISFDAQGNSTSNIDYRALEVFKSTVKLSYYDYGRYMRFDEAANDYVEIPTACMSEVTEAGVVYGVYHRGTPGCETSVLTLEEQQAVNGEGQTGTGQTDGTQAGEGQTGDGQTDGTQTVTVPVEDIRILRDYRTQEDLNKYMNEGDGENGGDGRIGGGYYFESKCIVFGDRGIDEAETRIGCPLVKNDPLIQDSSNGRDAAGNLVLRFSTSIVLNEEVFKYVNKHMRVIGPSRQNVTDSYTQIRDMFTERARDCSPSDADYQQCMQEVPSGN